MNHSHSGVPSVPVILTIAGFDPSGGAGIAADLKTFAAHNCYGVAAVTALTVQNTQGVTAVHAVEPARLKACVQSLLADGATRAVKIGMLATKSNAQVVGEMLEANPALPSVLDPVVRSASGFELLDPAGFEYLRDQLMRLASVITPNLDEAAALTGLNIANVEEMKAAARKLLEMGAKAAVITGGRLDKSVDVFFDGKDLDTFVGDHVRPDNTHGTGCTFSSALACHLAQARNLHDSVMMAKAYVTEAIRKAYAIGPGRVPLNHFFRTHQTRIAEYVPTVPEPVH